MKGTIVEFLERTVIEAGVVQYLRIIFFVLALILFNFASIKLQLVIIYNNLLKK
jgi:hypothetical protein